MLVALEATAGKDFWGFASFANGSQILGAVQECRCVVIPGEVERGALCLSTMGVTKGSAEGSLAGTDPRLQLGNIEL